MDIQNLKSVARKKAFSARAIAHGKIEPDLVTAVIAVAEHHHVIAAYMPMRSEIDPLPAMRALHIAGKRVCVPVIIAKNAPLIFCEWTPECAMIAGEFGALIPEKQILLTPDLILAPLVAFDASGTRLGYGGGFYDRTLALNPVPYIGLAYSAQEAGALPFEPTDIKLNAVITELGIRKFA